MNLWTNAARDAAIEKGKSGQKLDSFQTRKLEEAVRVGNRASDAREALRKSKK